MMLATSLKPADETLLWPRLLPYIDGGQLPVVLNAAPFVRYEQRIVAMTIVVIPRRDRRVHLRVLFPGRSSSYGHLASASVREYMIRCN
jgi:hypothetical protein